MGLDVNKTSRDYLYGRLLAVAERIEELALYIADENRATTAAKLMQRFAERPYSTWRTIELQIKPYMMRLQNARPGFLTNRNKELDTIMDMFNPEEFLLDTPLPGEFLLAFHCQRLHLKFSKQNENNSEKEE